MFVVVLTPLKVTVAPEIAAFVLLFRTVPVSVLLVTLTVQLTADAYLNSVSWTSAPTV
ncbi:MAG: hypothetical protein AABO58_07640 [Acidobacteriota bacterium]